MVILFNISSTFHDLFFSRQWQYERCVPTHGNSHHICTEDQIVGTPNPVKAVVSGFVNGFVVTVL